MRRGAGRQASGVRVGVAMLLGIAGSSVACARALPPPGGERDETPPQILATSPASMSTIAPSDEPVVIEFEERISERGIEDAVYVSPVTGSADVTNGRRDIEVRLAGGWQPGRVYRVVLRPVVQDLFNNRMERAEEIVFSTGAPFSDAAAAGVAYERVTGNAVAEVRVEAHPVDGGAYHLALTDSAGIFRMPLLPPGTYLLRGYADQNRDRRRDPFEPGDSTLIEVGQADTVLRPLALMRPDSSPANLTRVQVVDSVTLRVQFDDYMDVTTPQQLANVLVRTLPDSTVAPLAGVYYPHVLSAERARQDSIARDSIAAADTTAERPAPVDPVAAAPDGRVAAADSAAGDTIPPDPLTLRVREANLRPASDQPLPARELMVLLDAPLVPGAEYTVQVRGILNLAGVPDGGGTGNFRAPTAPPATEQPAEAAPGENPDAAVEETPRETEVEEP